MKTLIDDDAPIEANHRIQHQYPSNIRFCPLCGGEVRMRLVLPDQKPFKVCSRCGFINFIGPKLVAACLVIDRGKVLLLRRGIEPARGLWTFPGGFVDLGETPVQAAQRETLEEVGLKVRVGQLLGLYTDEEDARHLVAVYLAQPNPRHPPSVSPEAMEVAYFAKTGIPWGELAFPTTSLALKDWHRRLAGRANATR